MADLLIRNARLVATVDADRRELPGGWVAIDGGLISAVGSSIDVEPAATEIIDAGDCLVTPGLINTHHHLFQNLTTRLPADDRQAAVRLAAVAVPAVAGDRRGGGSRQRVRRSCRAGR